MNERSPAPAPFSVLGIDHIVLRSRNPDRLIDFYCRVLGLRIERRVDEIGLVQLRAGGSLIDIVPRQDSARGYNLEHFCLRVDPFDADELRTFLKDAGVEVIRSGTAYGAEGFGPNLYLHDPDGNQVEMKGPSVVPPEPA